MRHPAGAAGDQYRAGRGAVLDQVAKVATALGPLSALRLRAHLDQLAATDPGPLEQDQVEDEQEWVREWYARARATQLRRGPS